VKTSGLIKIALGLAALLGGSAMAAQVTVAGTHNIATTGTTGPLGVDRVTGMSFMSGSGNDFVRGTVNASNIFVASEGKQYLQLTLTSFEWRSTSNSDVMLTVNLVQDYTVAGTVASATGSHQLNGNVNFSAANQLARVSADSMHEGTRLPVITYDRTSAGAGTQTINVGQGQTTPVTVSGVYRIMTTYTFTINARSGVVSIILPDSGVDDATICLVPLPTSAYAGLSCLAGVGLMAWQRRRRQSDRA
jgi:hypothetical protein